MSCQSRAAVKVAVCHDLGWNVWSRGANAWADGERACACVELRVCSEVYGPLVGTAIRAEATVTDIESAENRYAKVTEPVTQHVNDRPSRILVAGKAVENEVFKLLRGCFDQFVRLRSVVRYPLVSGRSLTK